MRTYISTPTYVRLACALTVFLASCKHTDPDYCADAPHHNCLAFDAAPPPIDVADVADAAIDAYGGCRGNSECVAPTGVCDLTGTKVCVQCTAAEPGACTATTPLCGSDLTCHGCTLHTDCAASLACLPDGACGTDANVAYVDPTGIDSNSQCTRAAPCTKVSKALATSRPFVKFQGVTQETSTVSINDQNVTILADPGAQLTRTNNGLILEVKGSSRVTIYDLEVTGASSGAGVGISLPPGNAATLDIRRAKITNNAGGGISATGGTVTVSQSTISGNQGGGISATGGTVTVSQSTLSGNPGGGISTSGGTLVTSRSTISLNLSGGISVGGVTPKFDITNTFIFRNGDLDNSTFGGLNLNIATAGANRLEFNTIVDNRASPGLNRSGGVVCGVAAFAAPNNIIARNLLGGSATDPNAQTLSGVGACTYPSSTIASDVTGLLFVAPEIAPFDYHVMAGSSVIDQATTASTIDVDFDGDHRPQGAANDRGADEHK